jgi:hypothetical protein
MLPRWLRLAVWLAIAAPSGAQSEPVPGQRSRLAELAARDARLEFTAESARRARAFLDTSPPVQIGGAAQVAEEPLPSGGDEDAAEERALALFALGGGGGSGDVARIESVLESGALPERRAALFALGELAGAGWPALERVLVRDTAGLEETLCLALALAARGGAGAAEERLHALAEDENARLKRPALRALAWRTGTEAEGLGDTLQIYYELRRRAAEAYGLVDGRHGQEARKIELFANEEFLDRVVLAAAAELPGVALETHLAEILQAGNRPGALRVAVLQMPEELERALLAGEWRPSPDAWRAMLSEIDARRTERRSKKLLAAALQTPELEPLAGRLLFRAGGDLPWTWVRAQLEEGDPALRAGLVEACGDRGEKELVPELADLLEARADLGLSAPGLVALVRLAHAPAKEKLEELLQGSPTEEREQVLRALARVLHDKNLRRYAEQALRREDLPKELRRDLEVALAQNGAPIERGELRAALLKTRNHTWRLACTRALACAPEAADLEALAALFPVGDDLELDVELALALLHERHAATRGLLSAALWSADWNRSVLAGGLIVANAGPRGLQEELDSAPRTASERDLRRVGFALGEWGGIGAVETLTRTRSEGDPVLQGALLGALASRAEGGAELATPHPKVKLDFPAEERGGSPAGGTKKPGAKKKPPRAGG